MKTTLKQVPVLVSQRKEFNCNGTLFALIDGNKYVVYSYGQHFPVAVYQSNTWFVNKDKYSVTTSKHQGKVKAGINELIEYLSTYELKNLLSMPTPSLA
jgi:hypothetical protein